MRKENTKNITSAPLRKRHLELLQIDFCDWVLDVWLVKLDSVVIWFFAPSSKNRTWCFWFLALIIRRNKSRLSEYGCYVRVNCRVVKVKALKFSLRVKELLMQISKSVPMERGIAHVFCPHWLQEHSSTEKRRTKFNFWEISWKPGYIIFWTT